MASGTPKPPSPKPHHSGFLKRVSQRVTKRENIRDQPKRVSLKQSPSPHDQDVTNSPTSPQFSGHLHEDSGYGGEGLPHRRSPSDGSPSPTRKSSGTWKRVSLRFNKLLDLSDAVAKPPVENPDGLTNEEARPATDAKVTKHNPLAALRHAFHEHAVISSAETGLQALETLASNQPIDDKELLQEHVVNTLNRMRPDSPLQHKLTGAFIKMLWNDMQHGENVTLLDKSLRFRSADGSGNNPRFPSIGAAKTPYARSVPPLHPLPDRNLPDPSLIFDTVMKRDGFVPNPSGISSLLFSFATMIIHCVFNTNRQDPTINDTSSYLDLSIIYGNDQETQDQIRDKNLGLGKIYPDVFAESRFLLMPPAISALTVLFSRNHNYIAQQLFQINEAGWYKDPSILVDVDAKAAQDEDIFQRSRLVNCGFFVNAILHDYVRTILNGDKTDSSWLLDPRADISSTENGRLPRGGGNTVSVEFNLLYRWHSALSDHDENWTEQLFARKFPRRNWSEISPEQYMAAAAELSTETKKNHREWNIAGIKRGADGKFLDDDLAAVLNKAIESPAGAFRARGHPDCLRVIELLSIKTARRWGVCSLNEFRQYLNLKPYESFEEFNTDPAIAQAMKMLYVHPDQIELYPGLMAERAKGTMDGSGLCPGYTISRAILSDAVALVRGDRFFTPEFFNVHSLTAWGYSECASSQTGSFGGIMNKIFLRNLPQSYPFNNAYALFPFTLPHKMKINLEKLSLASQYDFQPPVKAPKWIGINSYEAVNEVLRNHVDWGVIYTEHIKELSKGDYGFILGFDGVEQHQNDRRYLNEVVFPEGFSKDIENFFSKTLVERLREMSFSYTSSRTMQVDLVRDVANLISTQWLVDTLGLPLKTEESPHGLFTLQELYQMLAAMFIFVFLNFDPVSSWQLREHAIEAKHILGSIIELRILQQKNHQVWDAVLHPKVHDWRQQHSGAPQMGDTAKGFYRRLIGDGTHSMDYLVSNALGIATASNANQGVVIAQTVNFYLNEDQHKNYDRLRELAQLNGPSADNEIRGFIWEAMRLDPQAIGIPRVAKKSMTIEGKEVHAGDWVLASIVNSGLDPLVFKEPHRVNPRRKMDDYRVLGYSMHSCLGARFVAYSLPAMIREIFKLKGLRRAPGRHGELHRFYSTLAGSQFPSYFRPDGTIWPFPTSLSVVYDQ